VCRTRNLCTKLDAGSNEYRVTNSVPLSWPNELRTSWDNAVAEARLHAITCGLARTEPNLPMIRTQQS